MPGDPVCVGLSQHPAKMVKQLGCVLLGLRAAASQGLRPTGGPECPQWTHTMEGAAGAVERHCAVPRRGLGLIRLLTKAALKLKRLSWAGWNLGPDGLGVRCRDFVFALETEGVGAGVSNALINPNHPDAPVGLGFYLSSALGPHCFFGLRWRSIALWGAWPWSTLIQISARRLTAQHGFWPSLVPVAVTSNCWLASKPWPVGRLPSST